MTERIDSWAELRARAREIIERLNAERRLALAAAANPVLAVEHLGFVIEPEARCAITDRLRLGPEDGERLAGLREEVAGIAGRRVDPDDATDVRRLLDEVGISPVGCPDTAPPRWRPGGAGADPLGELRDRHPVMGPLLEYRRLSARAPGFAPQRLFDAVLAGELGPKVTVVTGRLQRESGTRGPK